MSRTTNPVTVNKRTVWPRSQAAIPRAMAKWVFPLCRALHKGKTHLAVALGLHVSEQGYGVYLVRAQDLLADLLRAPAEHGLDRRMRIDLAPKWLIIDEFGLWPYDRTAAPALCSLIAAR